MSDKPEEGLLVALWDAWAFEREDAEFADAELRRLHVVNQELLEALQDFSAYVHAEQSATDGAVQYSTTQINRVAFKARAAIAKATGEQQ